MDGKIQAEKSTRGGRREGAGRPKGATKPEGQRKQRMTRAYDDEWELLKRFERLIKHGNKEACIKALEKLETK